MRRSLHDEEWLAILSFLGGKEQGVVLSSLSHRFECLVLTSEQFLEVTLNLVPAGDRGWAATDLGRRAIHDGVHWIDPRLQIGTAQSSASGGLKLVERISYTKCSFHEVHGRHRHAERKAAAAFCDKHGKYRLECVKVASGTEEPDGFLIIDSIHCMKVPKWIEHLEETDIDHWRKEFGNHVHKEWRQSRVPAKIIGLALRRLLQNTPLNGRWTLAVHEAKTESDTRAFMHAGFRQAGELVRRGDGNFLFAVPAFLDLPLVPSWVVYSMPIMERPQILDASSWPTGVDKSLGDEITLALTMEKIGKTLDFHKLDARLDQLITEGASIKRSLVLHRCAELGRPDLLAACIRFASPLLSAVNSFDPLEQTPLMCAVKSDAVPGQMKLCVKKLIECRADVGSKDAAGFTALGHLWRKAREDIEVKGEDPVHAFWACDVLEGMLTPTNGPSQADVTFKISVRDYLWPNADPESDDVDEDDEAEFENDEL